MILNNIQIKIRTTIQHLQNVNKVFQTLNLNGDFQLSDKLINVRNLQLKI